MKWKNKFNYPKSTRSIEDGYRKYSLGEEKLPSVTTILSATKSEEEKAALANWRERVGFKEANRIKTEASSRGTSMHSYICLLYTSPSPRDSRKSRMPSSA